MASFQTLTTTKYFPPGVYIGQLIQPAPGNPNVQRIPCYIGRGSRFSYASDLQIRRSFIYAEELTFPLSAPYINTPKLNHNASNQKAVSRLIRSDGVVVKTNQWDFLLDPDTNTYNKIIINPEAYDPTQVYKLDYQSIDRDVLDPLPVSDIRDIVALGSSPGSPDYTEYRDFFLRYTVSTPVGSATNTNSTGSRDASVTSTASGTGVVGFNVAFDAASVVYNRFYQLRCVDSGTCIVGGVSQKYAEFAWQSNPMSAGNDNEPAVPLLASNSTIPVTAQLKASTDPTADLVYPRVLVVDDGSGTMSATLETGRVLDFTFGGGNFAVDDLFTFNVYGPALFELDARIYGNTNQVHQSGPVVAATGNTTTVSVDFAGTNKPTNTYNLLYKMECLTADQGSHATISHSNGSPLTTIQFKNKISGEIGNDSPTNTREVAYVVGSTLGASYSAGTLTITRVVNSGAAASVIAGGGVGFCKITGVSGMAASDVGRFITLSGAASSANNGIFEIVQVLSATDIIISNPLAVVPDANNTSIAWNNSSTFGEVADIVNSLSSSDISASILSGNSNVVVAPVGPYQLTGGNDNTFTFMWSEYGNNINVSGITPILTQTTTGTSNPAPTASIGSSGVVVQFDCVYDNFKAATQASATYVNGGDSFVFAARTPGSAGNVLSVEIVSGASFDCVRTGNKITFTADTAVATTAQLAAFINSNVGGAGSGVVARSLSGLGTTLVSTLAETDLSGGEDADSFTFPVLAPRGFYNGKDSRNISMEITKANNTNGPGAGLLEIYYVSDTPEGGFGVFSTTANALSPSTTGYSNGAFSLNNNVSLFARNLFGGPTSSSSGNKHTIGDKTTFSVQMGSLDSQGVRKQTIDWSLVDYTYETIGNSLSPNNYTQSDVLTDVTGIITGVPATSYAILQHVPDTIISVKSEATGALLSYSLILSSSGENTQYIAFPTKPVGNVTVYYKYRGIEPDPGQFYFLTGKYIRPDEYYNTPILISSLDEGRKLLDPPEVLNHLSIMNEIVMGDIGAPSMYVIQVKDPDHDGNFTDVDFKNAIKASETPTNITDLIVLSHISSLNDQLASVTSMSDPFKQRFRLAWIGAPIGKPIGDETTPDSLVYLAQRTLQTHGTSPAHGTRILVAPTLATRDIQIDNSTVVEVSLDGSFVAGALAALVASFSDPGADILRKSLPGFKSIQTYGERGSPENLILGGNNIVFFTNQGGGVFQIEENVTVDNFASDFNLINNMTQKMAVTKYVREELDSKVIGLVVPSSSAGVTLIQGFLVAALSSLVSRGVIGSYQSADGTPRPIDPSADVQVQRDPLDPTRYQILYAYYLRNTIKRITGLYAVNTNNFGTGA